MKPRNSFLAPALACLAIAALLAGCTASGGTTLHFQQTQCEQNPWGAGADATAIAQHYGVTVSSAKEVDDGMGYADVCGGPSSVHIQAEVEGDTSGMEADGWEEGPVAQGSA